MATALTVELVADEDSRRERYFVLVTGGDYRRTQVGNVRRWKGGLGWVIQDPQEPGGNGEQVFASALAAACTVAADYVGVNEKALREVAAYQVQ